MIVVDTNIIVYLHIEGEFTADAEKLYQADSNWAAPLLWRSEFRNVLLGYFKRQQFSFLDYKAIVRQAESLLHDFEYDISSDDLFYLLEAANCSAYDCEFVALANKLNVPLITQDKKILQSFPNVAYSLRDVV